MMDVSMYMQAHLIKGAHFASSRLASSSHQRSTSTLLHLPPCPFPLFFLSLNRFPPAAMAAMRVFALVVLAALAGSAASVAVAYRKGEVDLSFRPQVSVSHTGD